MPLLGSIGAAAARAFGRLFSAELGDIYSNYVTLLLNGDGANGTQNNTFRDSSSNNFTITRNGNTTQGSFSPFGDTWSNYFDGAGDFLSSANSTSFDLPADFTLEAWVYCTSTANAANTIAGKWDSAGTNNQFAWIFGVNPSTGSVYFGYGNSGTYVSSVEPTGVFKPNTWQHIAVSRSGSTVKLFVNGTQAGSNYTITSNLTSVSEFRAGRDDATTRYFNGYISNLRVVKGTALYTANFIPPSSPLTAITNTSLLTCQSNRFIDNSTNNFAITVNGNTSVQKFSPFLPNGNAFSNYFDGTGDYLTVPDNPALDFGGDNFTVECWVSLNSSPGTSVVYGVVGKAANSSVYQGFAIYFYQSTAPRVAVTHNGTSWGVLGESSISLSINKWAHIALTRNGNTYTLWVDGQSGFSTTLSGSIPDNSAALSIGALAANGEYVFPGYISNLRIVKGTAVYTTAFTPPLSPLPVISGTSLLTCNQRSFIDASSNNFTITASGNVIATQFHPFQTASSGYFDGTGDQLVAPDNSAFAFGTGDFTLEAWIYRTGTATSTILTNLASSADGDSALWLYINTNNAVVTSTWFTVLSTSATNTVRNNEWTHIAYSRLGTNASVWVNGTRVSNYTFSNNLSRTTGYRVGAYSNGASIVDVFTGYISNARVIKGTAVYDPTQTTIIVPSAPLVATPNTSLLLNFGDGAIVDSAMMNNLETVGNAQVSTTQSKFGGGSLSFDGTGDYLSLLNNINLQLTNTTPFTIEMWVYPNVIQSIRVFLSAYKTTSPFEGYALRINSNGAFEFWDGTSWTSFGVTASANTWTHLAVSYEGSGTTRRLFVNGVQNVSAGTVPSTINYTAGSFIVGGDLAGNDPFNGYIDELRVTKGIARYTANFTPPTRELSFGTQRDILGVDLLVVAGGGGGSQRHQGGGGAGGAIRASSSVIAGTTYIVTVGAGGAGANAVNLPTVNPGAKGSSSSINFFVAEGGGGANSGTSINGGSGAGGFVGNTGSGVAGQGNNGGDGGYDVNGQAQGSFAGGGGGGAGAVGGNASINSSASIAGNGGAGVEWPTGSGTFYAGGGGGGCAANGGGAGSGGSGGGGAGGGSGAGTNGTANRGGGGGGGGFNFSSNYAGGNGGSGVVIISAPRAAVSTTGSPTVTSSGGRTIYTFTASGSITF